MKKITCFQFPIILLSLSFGFLSFILPIYAKELEMNAFEIGLLFSVVSLTSLIVRPYIGRKIDDYGRKVFLFVSSIFIILALLCYAFSTTMYLLYIARILHAIGISILSITIYVISIDLSAQKNVGNSIGILEAASSRGGLYGAFIGFSMLMLFTFLEGWRYIFLLYSACGIYALIFLLKKVPETKTNEVLRKTEKLNYTRLMLVLLLIVFLSSLTASMTTPIFMVYLQDHISNNVGHLAMAFIPASIVYSIFPPRAGKIVDRYGRKKILILGKIISGVIIILFVQFSSINVLILLWALEAVGIILASISYKAFISTLFGKNQIGKGYGIYMMMISLGGFLGTLFGGYFYELSHTLPFYLNACIKVIDLVIIILFVPKIIKK